MPKKYLGYHNREEMACIPIKKGSIVKIPRGTIVKQVGKDPKLAGKTYLTEVHHLLSGRSVPAAEIDGEQEPFYYRNESGQICARMVPVENPKVVWPGSGGYWCEADINDVELVD